MFNSKGMTGAAFACAALVLSSLAPAATFGLSPMRVDLTPLAPTAVLNVNNSGERPVTIQVRSYTWAQPKGNDVYEETRGFIISPAIFTIAPGATQLVRIAQRARPAADVERAYRLVVAEIPQAEEVVTGEAVFRVAIHMNIPMYVAPSSGVAAPAAVFVAEANAEGARLRIDNKGSGNLRLAEFTVEQEGAKLADLEVFVVLPRATRFVDLPKGLLQAGKPLRIRAQSNGGLVDLSVPPAKP